MADAASPATECPKCSGQLRWERLDPGVNERWVSLCVCGSFHTFFPSRPDWQPEDALSAALGAPYEAKQATPPWLRLFQVTSGYPWWLPWRHVAIACEACSEAVTFAVWTMPRHDTRAHSMICLSCGQATVEHVYPALGHSETPVSGREWTPACVAVARLRRAVFTRSPVVASPPLKAPPSQEGESDPAAA